MEFYTFDQIKDDFIGIAGTDERDAYEAELQSFLLGETLKKARLQRNLTQEELSALLGVPRQKISKAENGKDISVSLLSRLFKALQIKATIKIAGIGQVAL